MRAEIILKKFCFKVCRGTPQAGGDEYTAFRTGKEGNDRMDYTEMLTDNRFSVIAALPRNDLALAEAALEGGAQAVKVHCNVWHRASGNTFGTFAENRTFLRELIALCGDVPFPVSWTVKMKKKQKETQDILSYHTQAAGCSDKARAKASGGRQPIEECGRTGL